MSENQENQNQNNNNNDDAIATVVCKICNTNFTVLEGEQEQEDKQICETCIRRAEYQNIEKQQNLKAQNKEEGQQNNKKSSSSKQ